MTETYEPKLFLQLANEPRLSKTLASSAAVLTRRSDELLMYAVSATCNTQRDLLTSLEVRDKLSPRCFCASAPVKRTATDYEYSGFCLWEL